MTIKTAFPKINCIATPLRTEAALARVQLGEANFHEVNDGDVYVKFIHDKGGIVVLDYDY